MKIINYNELNNDLNGSYGAEFFQNIEFSTIESVNQIIEDVKKSGDGAVIKYSRQFNDGMIDSLEVTKEEIQKAYKNVDSKTIEALKTAISNVKEFSQKQLACLSALDTTVDGVRLGHKIIPIKSAGCYIPGGNYPLPSTAVMTIVPAKAAGVKKVIACSPKIQDVTIVACDLAGADKIFRAGGVQAVAAMAYGTETIDKVDKIVGPGNKFVTAAKKQVFGECGIDFLAGPSEVLIIADDTANAEFVAADMLAQCEHDLDARAYLIAFSKEFAMRVKDIAEKMLETLETADIARVSFNKSFAVIVENLEQAIEISEKRAPEHLEICVKNSENALELFSNYGSAFVGNYSAEVFGDYCAGTNHTLPTNKVARYCGGLSVLDFVKVQTYQIVSREQAQELAKTASLIAKNEGLFAHKKASDIRK